MKLEQIDDFPIFSCSSDFLNLLIEIKGNEGGTGCLEQGEKNMKSITEKKKKNKSVKHQYWKTNKEGRGFVGGGGVEEEEMVVQVVVEGERGGLGVRKMKGRDVVVMLVVLKVKDGRV